VDNGRQTGIVRIDMDEMNIGEVLRLGIVPGDGELIHTGVIAVTSPIRPTLWANHLAALPVPQPVRLACSLRDSDLGHHPFGSADLVDKRKAIQPAVMPVDHGNAPTAGSASARSGLPS
jgi:hypothetical protein